MKIIEYEIDNNRRLSRHKAGITGKYYDNYIRHAGCKIKLVPGWQKFNVYGEIVKARIIREWIE